MSLFFSKYKKEISDKYKTVLVSYRPNQEQIVKNLQSKRILSKVFQNMLDTLDNLIDED